MYDLIDDLPPTSWVLDLGAGPGSFRYGATKACVLGIDVAFPSESQPCAGRVIADSRALPLQDGAVVVVVCNHVLEHFEHLFEAVREIHRVLKAGGHLWAAVPDGFSFDDDMYRYFFLGGGHVNRFSFESFLERIEQGTALRAQRYKTLFTGFVYLNRPDPESAPHYPDFLRGVLTDIPPRVLDLLLRWVNYLARRVDILLGTTLSRYGWGVVFRREAGKTYGPRSKIEQLGRIPTDANVCFRCGSGHPDAVLLPRLGRFGPWKTYKCFSCGAKNLFLRTDKLAPTVPRA